jgi:hypothetical protein
VTAKQKELMGKHGTPSEFRQACYSAFCNLMITAEEFESGVAKYEKEWKEAGVCEKKT